MIIAMMDFRTRRLIIRDWRPDLADPPRRRMIENALGAILSESVLAHLPEPLQLARTPASIPDWMSARAAESDVMLVKDAPSKALIGLLILAQSPEPSGPPELHIGYLLGEAAWGRGYATELVQGLVTALADNGPLRVIGGVGQGNPASARVLEKAGFVQSTRHASAGSVMFEKLIT